MIDTLHTVELGVAAHIIGNIFWELISAHAFGKPNQQENAAELEKRMHSHYKTHKTSGKLQGKLVVERIRTSKGWPKIKAKAAAVRHLAPFAVELAKEFNTGTLHDRRRVALAELLVEFYKILQSEDMFLNPDARVRLPELGYDLCMLYSNLADEAARNGVKGWKFSPKHHLMLHLCEWQGPEYGNPRFYWVYADEDLVGRLIEVAHSCHPSTMSVVAIFKWMTFAFRRVA